MNQNISFGAYPSKKDPRDIKFSPTVGESLMISEHITDISKLAIDHQHEVGKCTSYLKSIIEWLYLQKTGVYVELSEDFLYIVGKTFVDKNWNEGSSLRTMIQAAMKYGVARESVFPSDPTLTHQQLVAKTITKEAWNDALNYKIGGYVSIPIEPTLIKLAIKKFGMLYTMVEVGDRWWTPSWNKNHILPLKKSSPIVSGHAVCVYGYKASDKLRIHLKNSWGITWADNGNGYFDYEDYMPHLRELFAITLESQMHLVDNSPTIEEGVWKGLLNILKKIGMISQ
jgi:hypothetical protein